MCTTETWFKPEFDDSNFEIINYSCTRLVRKNDLRGAGIAFYFKKGIKTSIQLMPNIDDSTEFLAVEILAMNHQRCLLIGVYNTLIDYTTSNYFASN